MDFSKLSASQQVTVGAAAAMILISFIPWYGVSGATAFSAWRSGLAGPLAVVAVVAAGVVLIMEAMDRAPVDSPAQIAFYLSAVGMGFVLWRMLFTESQPRRIGLFLALTIAAVACWAAYQNFRDNS
jgi:uncharacterized membrane protein